jgi:hypothetical protein
MRSSAIPASVMVLALACRGPAVPCDAPIQAPIQDAPQDPRCPPPVAPEPVAAGPGEPIDYEHVLGTGFMLRSPDQGWGAHLMVPVGIGLTQFDLADISLDQVASVAVVPTLEFLVPLDDRWTLMPFAGLGGAVQVGDGDLIGGRRTVGLLTGGVRAMRWEPFAERYTSIVRVGAEYDAVFSRRDGLLGDWGKADLVVEVRRAFGEPCEGSRFEPGVYAQGFWFWDPVELDIDGVTPELVHNQVELGFSLGGTEGFEVFGISLPRLFVGFRLGGDLQSLQIRFGRL